MFKGLRPVEGPAENVANIHARTPIKASCPIVTHEPSRMPPCNVPAVGRSSASQCRSRLWGAFAAAAKASTVCQICIDSWCHISDPALQRAVRESFAAAGSILQTLGARFRNMSKSQAGISAAGRPARDAGGHEITKRGREGLTPRETVESGHVSLLKALIRD